MSERMVVSNSLNWVGESAPFSIRLCPFSSWPSNSVRMVMHFVGDIPSGTLCGVLASEGRGFELRKNGLSGGTYTNYASSSGADEPRYVPAHQSTSYCSDVVLLILPQSLPLHLACSSD